MEIWILILITTIAPNKILYDPYLETVSEPACKKHAELVRQTKPEVQTFCVKKR